MFWSELSATPVEPTKWRYCDAIFSSCSLFFLGSLLILPEGVLVGFGNFAWAPK